MELELVYNEETQEWEQRKEPFITIEVETEEDFEFIGNAIAFYKKQLEKQEKLQTNADRIRAMSDEELAELFYGFCDNGERCVYCPLYEKSCAGVHSDVPKWLEWLQQPVEGEYP